MTLARLTDVLGMHSCVTADVDHHAKVSHVHVRSWSAGFGRFTPMDYRRFGRRTFVAIFKTMSDAIWREGNCQVLFRLWRFGVAVMHRPGGTP
jgi:hypothetical protein